jgi:hypothetical protein
LGPEGGQFSIFFRQGVPFEFENWQTPAPIDWGSWEVRICNWSTTREPS